MNYPYGMPMPDSKKPFRGKPHGIGPEEKRREI
jgi:hypothetical protein